MDDDDMRRGRPTAHRAFDEATAILAGDALLTYAFDILSSPETHSSPEVRLTLVSKLARAAGAAGMVSGQMLDIEAEASATQALEAITTIQTLKTGALFRFACEAGAVMGGADPDALLRYASKIGLAFQIADDILDIESTPEALGKATQKDRGKGKATFVDVLGLTAAKAQADTLVAEAISSLAPYGDRAATLNSVAQFIVTRRK
jgi:farnesyl diphosphate synthase